jgi:hypothetical protein
MPKQHYIYSYDTIDIFQKLSNNYASLKLNIKIKLKKYHKNVLFQTECKSKKRVVMFEVFLWMAGLLFGISLGFRSWEILQSSPASPRKTPSIAPLLLGLTQYAQATLSAVTSNAIWMPFNI